MRKTLILLLAALPGLLVGPNVSEAAICVWTGAGGNAQWSTPGNWVANDVPTSGDAVVIPSNVAATLGVNNLVGLTLSGIVIQHAYTLTGSEILLGSNGLHVADLPGNNAVVLAAPFRLTANQTWVIHDEITAINSSIALNSRSLTLQVTQTGLLQLGSVISGTGAIVKTGVGMARFSGNSSYAGPTTINEGYLAVHSITGLGLGDGTAANGTVVNGTSNDADMNGSLHIVNAAIGNEAITVQGTGQSNNGALAASGNASIAGPLTVASDIGINVIAPAQLTFNGPIGGPGRLVLVHDGTFYFGSGNNTYTGGLGIGEGGSHESRVIIGDDEGIPFAPLQNVPATARLTLDVHVTQTLAGLTGGGSLLLADSASQLVLNGSGEQTFAGGISGQGVVKHVGTGHQRFTSPVNAWPGRLIVERGTVSLVNMPTAADATTSDQGLLVLTGTSSVDGILVNGGELRVSANVAGVSKVAANSLTVQPEGSMTLDSVPGAGSNGTFVRLSVAGAVSLDGTLTVPIPQGFVAPVGTEFVLITNLGSDPVVGTFANLPQHATIAAHGATFRIAYDGGDGNDVTLTLISLARDYLLSEGAVGPFFTTEILIANPNQAAVPIHVSFLKPGGGAVEFDDEVAPMSRKTIVANDVAALDVSEFSTVVRSMSGLPLVVERTMTWDRTLGYGAHTERAADGAATTWYFAEGSQGFFSTYLLLANPNTSASLATVEYLIENGAPVTRTYDVPALSRRTIDAGADSAFVNQSFGMVVTFTQPGLAERAMYFGLDPLWRGGHASAGATTPSTSAYVAEGATGPFFETYVLIANPNPSEVDVTLTFGRQADTPIQMTRSIPASSRLTLNLETLDPGLANTPVSTRVDASLPVIVERAQYWPDPAPQWHESHGGVALQTLNTKWGFAEGRVGGPSSYQTYILLANTNTTDAQVSITFLRENGAPFTKTFTVAATQRLNVPVGPGTDVPELIDERFGALIISDQPIAVERAMYANAGGQVWAAGTSANGTPLPE
jgi:autotransporter-associated beta strand protein